MEIVSPLTGSKNFTKITDLSKVKVIDAYKTSFGIDVSNYFEKINEISIYKCKVSGLKFYFPFNLAGNADFYDELSVKYENYYSKWKWEHEVAMQYISKTDNVLEIGCGNGYFLARAKKDCKSVTGLDFNPSSIAFGKLNEINIQGDSVFKHKKSKKEFYDYISAFQLFEHVNEVGEFLKDTVSMLKKGGKLIIGVPNNDSPIFKYSPYHTLNLPPHHMLMWDRVSLNYLCEFLNLEIIEMNTSPIDSRFKSASYKVFLKSLIGENLISKAIHILTRPLIKLLPFFNEGQTIIAIFTKK